MRIFVTGSTGLLGHNVVRTALAAGHEVVGLTRSMEKFERLLGDTSATPVRGDMRAVDDFAAALAGCDAVVHCAAYFREYFTPGDHEEALKAINVNGTLALLAAADRAGVNVFVQVSSAGAVGDEPDGAPGDEDTPPSEAQMAIGYFRSKRDGDRAIAAFEPDGAMAIMDVLPGWLFGPHDAAPTTAGQLVHDLLAGKIPGVPDGGTCVVDARDVAAAILSMIDSPRHRARYIVAGPYMSLAEIMSTLARAAEVKTPRRIPVPVALAYAHVSELWARLSGRAPAVSVEGVKLMALKKRYSSARAEDELDVAFRSFERTAHDVVRWARSQH